MLRHLRDIFLNSGIQKGISFDSRQAWSDERWNTLYILYNKKRSYGQFWKIPPAKVSSVSKSWVNLRPHWSRLTSTNHRPVSRSCDHSRPIRGLIDPDWPRLSACSTKTHLSLWSKTILWRSLWQLSNSLSDSCDSWRSLWTRRDVWDNVRHLWNDVQLYATW